MRFTQFYLESLGHASYFIGAEATGEALVLDARRDVDIYLAEALCQTLQQKILTLPDFVEVYPTHVSGSLCGGHIGRRLSTTIGYERRMNRLLAHLSDQQAFVGECLNLEHLPAVPPYWRRMRALNQQGPPRLGTLTEPPALQVEDFDRWRRDGAVVLDCRAPEAFAAHIPEALNVGLAASFATWAGTVLPADAPVLLVLDHARDLWEVCWELLRIGYELPKGWLAGGMLAWRTAAKALDTLPQWTVWELAQRRQRPGPLVVLDVRQPQEWAAGHIPGALHITGAELTARVNEVPQDCPVATICGSGYRSSVAASLLQQRGYRDVVNVLGGMGAWRQAGFETVSEGDPKAKGRRGDRAAQPDVPQRTDPHRATAQARGAPCRRDRGAATNNEGGSLVPRP